MSTSRIALLIVTALAGAALVAVVLVLYGKNDVDQASRSEVSAPRATAFVICVEGLSEAEFDRDFAAPPPVVNDSIHPGILAPTRMTGEFTMPVYSRELHCPGTATATLTP